MWEAKYTIQEIFRHFLDPTLAHISVSMRIGLEERKEEKKEGGGGRLTLLTDLILNVVVDTTDVHAKHTNKTDCNLVQASRAAAASCRPLVWL
jgi:hypothetical protein